jgi:hypothetical protein
VNLETLDPAALREIALRLVAEGGRRRPGRGASATPGRPGGDPRRTGSEALIRRGVSIARRFGGLCSVLTVARSDADSAVSEPWRALADQLHCTFLERCTPHRPPLGGALAVGRQVMGPPSVT